MTLVKQVKGIMKARVCLILCQTLSELKTQKNAAISNKGGATS